MPKRTAHLNLTIGVRNVSATGRCDGRQSGDLKIFRLQTQMSGICRAIMRPHWLDRAISRHLGGALSMRDGLMYKTLSAF